ncbi:MAG: hypothetical protein KJO56_02100 [Gammaproteobacteria bacterium]|nr:hypothetical protein [Gammaproteobacteria bacterium]MBT8105203.1 hypothetical protein [Gammaproteobacteria bacterium]NNF50069.1 hypothetical protein [Woeseiaceae bacterium]NNK25217.1 hypothetical protein [Woeseiaceae bacterium]
MRDRLSVPILIAANLVPIAGVLLWGWDVFFILLLFWCENVIIGVFGIARMIVAGETDSAAESLFRPLFFVAHYGVFMLGHFMVLFGMYSGHIEDLGRSVAPADYYGLTLENLNWVALVALFISHGWSFVENYMGKREHERLTPSEAMALPYRRMVITHVALIFGGFLLARTGQPLAGLVLLVLVKIVMDVQFHKREHARLQDLV